MIQKIGWVGLGGIAGANARYWLGGWAQARLGSDFPWSTFVINVTGSWILGFFMALAQTGFGGPHAPTLRLLIAVGFVGAYTTFSTFEFETLNLVSTHTWVRAFGNAFGSLFAGFAAVWVGVFMGHWLQPLLLHLT